MIWICDYIEPGVYQHYKGGIYVVCEVVTHLDSADGHMMPLPEDQILVVYRDLEAIKGFVNGKAEVLYNRYARTLKDFKATVEHNGQQVKRFTAI